MRSRRPLLLVLALAVLATVPATARLGETVADLKKRFGRPELESRKDNVFWLFEGDNGQLLYTVTLNAAGRSIAEGLKPHKRARFHDQDALVFIDAQLAPLEGSKTLHTLKPGEHYRFAGQEFVCAQDEQVTVDEPNGLLLIWNKSVNPAVMVVSPEMFQRAK
jgi:hypothetical protein